MENSQSCECNPQYLITFVQYVSHSVFFGLVNVCEMCMCVWLSGKFSGNSYFCSISDSEILNIEWPQEKSYFRKIGIGSFRIHSTEIWKFLITNEIRFFWWRNTAIFSMTIWELMVYFVVYLKLGGWDYINLAVINIKRL